MKRLAPSVLALSLFFAGCGAPMTPAVSAGLQARVHQLRVAADGGHDKEARSILRKVRAAVKAALKSDDIEVARAALILKATDGVKAQLRPGKKNRAGKGAGGSSGDTTSPTTTIPPGEGDEEGGD